MNNLIFKDKADIEQFLRYWNFVDNPEDPRVLFVGHTKYPDSIWTARQWNQVVEIQEYVREGGDAGRDHVMLTMYNAYGEVVDLYSTCRDCVFAMMSPEKFVSCEDS